MVARNPARYLAPVALLATAAATVVVVSDVLDTTHHTSSVRRPTRAPTRRRQVTARPSTYVVQSGDSLSSIAVKTGVSVPALETLNPGVDPSALQTGQRLRLRR